MPKRAREWTALDVKRAAHPGRHARNIMKPVGGVAGLQLQISPNGAKSWLLRTVVGEKRRAVGLGPYPEVSLAHARDKAAQAKAKIAEGIDPIEERKAVRAALIAAQKRGLTFATAVDRYLDAKLSEFRNDKHRKQWRSTLDCYASPHLGSMLVDNIELPDILRTMEPIWHEKTETASRLRGRIEAVLNWATVAGHRTGDNPARWKGNLDALLPKPSKIAKVIHQPALAIDDAASWFADLRSRDGIATRALEFMALTVARSGEIRGALWSEIDKSNAVWIIPAERMKAQREHRIPLTQTAIALLSDLPRLDDVPFLFPNARGGMLSDAALSACMKRIHEARRESGYCDPQSGRPAVPHGLRSTFRNWAAERGYPRDMSEIALAHTVGSEVERAYRRTDMLERRRVMSEAWGEFLHDRLSTNVINLAVNR
jgi:integrase